MTSGTGGRLSMLAGRFRAVWLIWIAVAVQIALYYASGLRRLVEDQLHIPMLLGAASMTEY